MSALFEWAGVDYSQWKAISRTLLRVDFRAPVGQTATSHSLRTAGGFLLLFVMYGLIGLGAALVTLVNQDVLLAGMVALLYVTFMVVTAVLTQHGATIVSTTDYAILAPRPVSSRTFLAVRLTNVLFHTIVLTTMMGYPFVIAQAFAHGTSLARGIAAAAALYAYSIATTFALVAGYGALLRVIGAARLQRALSYAQLGMGVLSYAGVFMVMDRAGRSVLQNLTLPRGEWLFFVPPAWYASYLELATGIGDAGTWVRAGLSIACLGVLLVLLRGPLALEYGERLGALAAASSSADAGASMRRGWFFTHGEARAVALLVRAQFRHDLRVRLGILSVIPMTLFYMFMGSREGGGGDPFLEPTRRGFDFMAMVVLFFPSVLVQQLSGSDAYKASWIYFATPADRAAIIVSAKNVIVACFLAPFALFLAALFTWRFGHPGHGVVHAAFLGLVGHLVLQTAVLVQPRLPFAAEPRKGSGNAAMFFWMMTVMMVGTLMLIWLQAWVYRTWWRVTVVAAALLVVAWLLNLPLRARAGSADELPAAT